MKTSVISQPMYFPWRGIFEQILLADDFVFYDDVQYARGFINRVQIKTPQGQRWLTVPLEKHNQSSKINEICTKDSLNWVKNHQQLFLINYRKAPYLDDAMDIIREATYISWHNLAEIAIQTIIKTLAYLGYEKLPIFHISSKLNIEGIKGERIQNIVKFLGANIYVSGLGAMNYLDHHKLEDDGIEVRYMDYRLTPYPQLHGTFTPFVSILDLVANCGPNSRDFIGSPATNWRNHVR